MIHFLKIFIFLQILKQANKKEVEREAEPPLRPVRGLFLEQDSLASLAG